MGTGHFYGKIVRKRISCFLGLKGGLVQHWPTWSWLTKWPLQICVKKHLFHLKIEVLEGGGPLINHKI